MENKTFDNTSENTWFAKFVILPFERDQNDWPNGWKSAHTRSTFNTLSTLDKTPKMW